MKLLQIPSNLQEQGYWLSDETLTNFWPSLYQLMLRLYYRIFPRNFLRFVSRHFLFYSFPLQYLGHWIFFVLLSVLEKNLQSESFQSGGDQHRYRLRYYYYYCCLSLNWISVCRVTKQIYRGSRPENKYICKGSKKSKRKKNRRCLHI